MSSKGVLSVEPWSASTLKVQHIHAEPDVWRERLLPFTQTEYQRNTILGVCAGKSQADIAREEGVVRATISQRFVKVVKRYWEHRKDVKAGREIMGSLPARAKNKLQAEGIKTDEAAREYILRTGRDKLMEVQKLGKVSVDALFSAFEIDTDVEPPAELFSPPKVCPKIDGPE